MRLILIGCEYTGKTTLTHNLRTWMVQTMGSCETSFHDHFVPWDPEGADETQNQRIREQLLALEPSVLECYQRYMIHYHTSPSFYSRHDHGVVNWYYADAVYAALYYGFGGPGQYAERRELARYYDHLVLALAPDTILVLLTASVEAILRRRSQDPKPKLLPKVEDIPQVLARFHEEYEASLISRRLVLDTTHATPEETLREFVRQVEPHLSAADRLRMWTHQAQARTAA